MSPAQARRHPLPLRASRLPFVDLQLVLDYDVVTRTAIQSVYARANDQNVIAVTAQEYVITRTAPPLA
jgi:hypothetical protein